MNDSIYTEDMTERLEDARYSEARRLLRGEFVVRAVLWLVVGACLGIGYSMARADDYQCVLSSGCEALLPGPGGTKTVRFKKGDTISTSSGWIVDPHCSGWREVNAALAGLLPIWE